MSFSMSMAFVRSDYLGQFAKPVSFCCQEPLKELLLVFLLAMFTVLLGVVAAQLMLLPGSYNLIKGLILVNASKPASLVSRRKSKKIFLSILWLRGIT